MTIDNCFFVIQSSKENERIKRNISSSNNARSKETKKSAKENGSFTSTGNTSTKNNVTHSKATESPSPIKSTSRKPRLKQRDNGSIPNTASKRKYFGLAWVSRFDITP